ncbi:hypothetical protein B7463_g8650, partial [Scytalidium lignicola]
MYQQSYSQRELPAIYPASTASTEKEALRVLEWQKDVARSVTSPESEYEHPPSRGSVGNIKSHVSRPAPRRYDSTPLPQIQNIRLVHRETITSRTYEEVPLEQQEKSKGMSNTALFGTLLGAAAGAAITYAMVQSKDSDELDPALAYPLPQAAAPPVGRARTVYTTQTKSTYVAPEEDDYITSKEMDDHRRVDVIPARSYVSARSRDESHHSVPRILPAYPQATSIREGSTLVGEEDIDRDRDGRKSHASGSSRRSRSETGSARYERPLTVLPAKSVARDEVEEESYVSARRGEDRRSSYSHVQAPSHHSHHSHHMYHPDAQSQVRSQAPSQVRSQAPSQTRNQAPSQVRSQAPSQARTQSYSQAYSQAHSQAASQSNTYVSAASRRSGSTIKPPSTVKVIPRDIDGPSDRRGSVVSARQVPLPRSMVSGAGYGDSVAYAESVVYAESLAPSDSVSSVGLKMERERMKGRMGY